MVDTVKEDLQNEIFTVREKTRVASTKQHATLHTADDKQDTLESITGPGSRFHVTRGLFAKDARKSDPSRYPWMQDAFLGLLCALKNFQGPQSNFTKSFVDSLELTSDDPNTRNKVQRYAIDRVNEKLKSLKKCVCTGN